MRFEVCEVDCRLPVGGALLRGLNVELLGEFSGLCACVRQRFTASAEALGEVLRDVGHFLLVRWNLRQAVRRSWGFVCVSGFAVQDEEDGDLYKDTNNTGLSTVCSSRFRTMVQSRQSHDALHQLSYSEASVPWLLTSGMDRVRP